MEKASPDGLATEATTEAVEMTEDQALEAVYDRLTSDGMEDEQPDEAPDQPEDEAAAEVDPEEEPQDGEEADSEEGDSEEPPPQAQKAPSFLPSAVKENWSKIPEEARSALAEGYQDMANRVNNATRLEKGLAPIKEVLTEASKAMPQLMDMKPAEVAQDMLQLARISQQFNERPVETVLELIQRHGLEGAISAAFQGHSVEPGLRESQLMQELNMVKRQLAAVSNPEYLEEQVTNMTARQAAIGDVQAFMNEAEHWDKVESHLPHYIAAVRGTKPEASNADTLREAYGMACSALGLDAKQAKAGAADEAAQKSDPKRADAARKAKSVNVSGTRSGKTRQLSETEALSAAYDRIMRR